jgi:Arc/MetJ-type ribon-helix-helix transcriptional regulator
MTDQPSWRRPYDALECNVAPQVEALVRTGEFSDTCATIARARRLVRNQVNGIAARLWHLINLPAGTDVQRLRIQVGALDREVRRLSLQLDRQVRQGPWTH